MSKALDGSKNTYEKEKRGYAKLSCGFTGLKAFELFMNDKRFRDIPKIIDTPQGKEWGNRDKANLKQLQAILKN